MNTVREEIPANGTVDAGALEILPNLLSPSHEPSNALDERAKLPWYKRPSPVWLLVGTFMAAIATSITIAPRIELYIRLACQEIRPDYESISIKPGEIITWPSIIGTVALPRPSARCQSDPTIQAAVAELGATMTTTIGVLSCLTAGWWGKFCDRYGRLKVLAITTFGVLISDLVFISVALASNKLPFGYRFLLLSPIVDGLLGGIASGSAASHAYLSDTTTPANRSRVFSRLLGLLFCGVAVGPALGGVLISKTGDLLSVFYLSAALHATYFLCALFIVPESLTKRAAAANVEAARRKGEEDAIKLARKQENMTPIRKRMDQILRRVFFFFSPLSIFLPSKIPVSRRRDWNLTLLAISYGFVTLLMGSYQFKFQYASYVFGWGSQELGYWLTVIGILRAIHLIVILPAFIKYFGPKRQTNPTDETSVRGLPHDPAFDLVVARLSLGIELLQYTLAVLSQNTHLFIAATLISAFSGGYTPSTQALAVELSKRKSDANRAGSSPESFGQLFGALGVIQALCSQMLGPPLFGSVFVKTVKYFPKGIFVTGGCIVAVALFTLAFIRVSPPEVAADEEREPLLPDLVHDD